MESITDFIGGGYLKMLGKEATCERCHQKFDPHWCLDDQMERDNCEECSKIIDNYEQEKSDRED